MSMDRLSKKNDHNRTINLPSHSNSRMASRKPSHCRMTTCVPIMCRPKFPQKKCLGNTALKKISTDHRAYIKSTIFQAQQPPPTDRNTSENPRKVGAHLRVNDPIPRSWVFSPRHHQWVEAPVPTTAHSFRSSRVLFFSGFCWDVLKRRIFWNDPQKSQDVAPIKRGCSPIWSEHMCLF